MSKFFPVFQKIIIALALICLLQIWGGTFAIAKNDFFTELFTPFHRVLLLGTGTILLLLGIRTLFRHIQGCSQRRLMCYSGILFALITILFVVFICAFRIIPTNDSHSIIDQALSMARSGEKPMDTESIYADYFSKYSNNYALALLFMGMFRLAEHFGAADVYLPLILLNMLCLLAGTLLTWLTARKVFGLGTAVKALLLCGLNAVYYLMVFWVYSNTLSIPFMMGLIYVGVCIYSAKSFRTKCALGAAEAVLCVLAFELRPTAVIPLIALFVCFLFYILRHPREFLKWLGVFAVGIAAAGILYTGIGKLSDSYFHTVSEGNYPVTHWLMMGSHDDGRYNLADDRFTFSFESSDEKKEATLSRTLENYRELGVRGTIKLVRQKVTTTWSDGYFAMKMRLNQNMRYSRLYAWSVTEKSDLFHLYCQCFWLAVILLVLVSCVRQLCSSPVRTTPFLLVLSLFGAVLFYFFWEVKEAYAIPFLPVFYLLAAEGRTPIREYGAMLHKKINRLGRSAGKCITYGTLGIGICMILWCGGLAADLFWNLQSYEITHNEYSILCNSTTWLKDIPLENGGSFSQEFYPGRDFNRIRLLARAEEDEGKNDCLYDISLWDASGNPVYTKTISAEDISKNNTVTLTPGMLPAAPEEGYLLRITRRSGSYGSITFRAKKDLCLDTYQGNLTVNGAAWSGDLYMQVSHTFQAPYCRPLTAAILCIGGWLIAAGILTSWLFRKRTAFSR